MGAMGNNSGCYWQQIAHRELVALSNEGMTVPHCGDSGVLPACLLPPATVERLFECGAESLGQAIV